MSDPAAFYQADSYRRWEAPSIVADSGRSGNQPTATELADAEAFARAEGYEAGRREGIQAAEKEIQQRTRQLDALLESLSEPLAAVNEAVERKLVELALAIARQVIRRELAQHPDEIVAVVREAVAALPPSERTVYIHVHPDDARLLREVLSIDEDERSYWRLQEDAGISRGGCRVVSGYAEADACLETRIQELAARLLGGERSDDDTEPGT